VPAALCTDVVGLAARSGTLLLGVRLGMASPTPRWSRGGPDQHTVPTGSGEDIANAVVFRLSDTAALSVEGSSRRRWRDREDARLAVSERASDRRESFRGESVPAV
jgi:hypothetical protein